MVDPSAGGGAPGLPAITVVLPTIDEAQVIGAVIEDVVASLDAVTDLRIIVVDDGSRDGTCAVVLGLSKGDSRIRFIRRDCPDGLASAIETGVRQANTPLVAWMDADGSMPGSALKDMLDARQGGARFVLGSRYATGGGAKGHDPRTYAAVGRRRTLDRWARLRSAGDSVIATYLGDALNWTLSRVLDSRVRDYTSGLVLTDRALALHLGFQGRHGEYCIRMVSQALAQGVEVREVAYVLAPRAGGRSKTGSSLVGIVRHGLAYLRASALAVRANRRRQQ